METSDEHGHRDAPKPGARLRMDADRADQLVRAVRTAQDEPFGPLRLVRAVIRPKRREPG